jgi:hypothetical protein
MILFDNKSRNKDEISNKFNVLCQVQNNIVYILFGKLIKTKSVL